MTKGNFNDFLNAINKKESSNNPMIVNKYGYAGLYQMGERSLIEAGLYKSDGKFDNKYIDNNWTGKNGVNSLSDFLSNLDAQNKAVTDFHAKAWTYIRDAGLDKYIGQTIGGVKITESGLIAGYHLKGLGNDSNPGLKQFLESNGKIIPMDGKEGDGMRTPINEYIKKFGDYNIDPIKSISSDGKPLSLLDSKGNPLLLAGNGDILQHPEWFEGAMWSDGTPFAGNENHNTSTDIALQSLSNDLYSLHEKLFSTENLAFAAAQLAMGADIDDVSRYVVINTIATSAIDASLKATLLREEFVNKSLDTLDESYDEFMGANTEYASLKAGVAIFITTAVLTKGDYKAVAQNASIQTITN